MSDTLRDVLAEVLHISWAEADDIIAALAARNVVLSDGALREAAQNVVIEAEVDDNWDGEYIAFLVSSDTLDALRAALAARNVVLTREGEGPYEWHRRGYSEGLLAALDQMPVRGDAPTHVMAYAEDIAREYAASQPVTEDKE